MAVNRDHELMATATAAESGRKPSHSWVARRILLLLKTVMQANRMQSRISARCIEKLGESAWRRRSVPVRGEWRVVIIFRSSVTIGYGGSGDGHLLNPNGLEEIKRNKQGNRSARIPRQINKIRGQMPSVRRQDRHQDGHRDESNNSEVLKAVSSDAQLVNLGADIRSIRHTSTGKMILGDMENG